MNPVPFQIIEKPFGRRPVDVDPITVDIIENALLNARREMDYVVFRSAMSTVIREQRDAYPLITDRDGRKVVGQFGSPIAGFTRGYQGTVEDGDVFLTSDPYECQGAISHCNDWLVVKPIYFEGHLVGWSGIFGHVMDIGGRVPGSVPINAHQYYEEGIIIPPTKVYRRGEMQADVVNLIMHNSRASNSNRADLTALVAAAQLAARRVVEICERFGLETYVATCDLLLARNRKAISQLIDTSIPEGKTYYFEDYVCDDGCGMGPYKIACSMVKRGKKLYFDFDGTDPQSQGSINFIFNYEMFKMFVGAYLIKLHDPQIVFNAGYYDLIEVNIPPGCLLNPIKPAALSCRTGTLQRTFDVLIGLLGQCTPGLMTAAGYSQSPYLYYSGYDDNGEWFTLFYSGFGGVPGRPIGDGHDGYTLLPSFFNLPTEFAESYAPVRVEQYSIVPDSGGPGLHRGGNGNHLVFYFEQPGTVSIHDSRWLTRPWGANGGLAAERSRKFMERADGTRELLPAMKDMVPVGPGDRLHFITWGGGGWGDPLERDPAIVALEVERGLVTREGAERYGVVLDADGGVDEEATRALRDTMRGERDDLPLFHYGDTIENIIARCEAETGLPPPVPPATEDRRLLAQAASERD